MKSLQTSHYRRAHCIPLKQCNRVNSINTSENYMIPSRPSKIFTSSNCNHLKFTFPSIPLPLDCSTDFMAPQLNSVNFERASSTATSQLLTPFLSCILLRWRLGAFGSNALASAPLTQPMARGLAELLVGSHGCGGRRVATTSVRPHALLAWGTSLLACLQCMGAGWLTCTATAGARGAAQRQQHVDACRRWKTDAPRAWRWTGLFRGLTQAHALAERLVSVNTGSEGVLTGRSSSNAIGGASMYKSVAVYLIYTYN